uniref:NADH dehydrogenase [ubiquinone] 1 beta subcomplex subunit 2, mitochondrial n=1 Tax=Neolamprologus brichardi TaxID=32507 RepID=A0A3Q4NAG4_NEOBR
FISTWLISGVGARGPSDLLQRGPMRIMSRKARQYPHLTEKQKFESELISGVMWFWILWHCWHDPDALLGHLRWPDASEWMQQNAVCIHPSIPSIPDDEE